MTITKIRAKSVSYGGKRSLSAVKYIVIHYTGVSVDTARAEGNYFAKSNTRSAGAHYFVDRSGNVVESIPMTLVAWSVGGLYTTKNGAGSYYRRCTNANSVSIELCDIVKHYPSNAQIKAVKDLVAYIKKKCPNAKTIIRHWDVSGKACPARMSGKGNAEWSKFKAAITNTKTATKSKGYLVKVDVDNLIVRTGPGLKYKSVAILKRGEVYTIVDSSSGWGKLKSGAGWVKLSYTQRI